MLAPSSVPLRELGLSLLHDTTSSLTSLTLLAAAGQRWLEGDRPAIDEARQCLSDMAMHTRRLADLLHALAHLAPVAVPPAIFDLRALLEDVTAELKPAFDRVCASLWLELPPEPVEIPGNAWQLRQVLLRSMHATAAVLAGADAGEAMHVRLDSTDAHAVVTFRSVARKRFRPRTCAATAAPAELAVLGAILRVHGARVLHGDPAAGEAPLTFIWERAR